MAHIHFPAKRECQVGKSPKSNDGYLEIMSKVIFRSNLNPDIIESKWPEFMKAFNKFKVVKVARYADEDLERLMENQGIIRNRRKIQAVIKNAREIATVGREFGSFKIFLMEVKQNGEKEMIKTLSGRFAFMGGATALFFLRAVGEEMPDSVSEYATKRSSRN